MTWLGAGTIELLSVSSSSDLGCQTGREREMEVCVGVIDSVE